MWSHKRSVYILNSILLFFAVSFYLHVITCMFDIHIKHTLKRTHAQAKAFSRIEMHTQTHTRTHTHTHTLTLTHTCTDEGGVMKIDLSGARCWTGGPDASS